FNAGSARAADGLAASAMVVTHIAAVCAALTWAGLDWFFHKKPTLLGAATGAVAGLVAITPAAGFVDVSGAIMIGVLVSFICRFFVVAVKNFFGYDDALDAFGVHGMGGVVGAIATGFLATPTIQSAYKGLFYGNPHQVVIQLYAVGISIVYSFVGSLILFKVIDLVIGLRVDDDEEMMGLDVTEHNERAYTVIE
ncbi:MAG: ammonia channel protein, partial [Candidatus Margulisiibacteriota bacterium]